MTAVAKAARKVQINLKGKVEIHPRGNSKSKCPRPSVRTLFLNTTMANPQEPNLVPCRHQRTELECHTLPLLCLLSAADRTLPSTTGLDVELHK